jgi:oxygen-dependent protoporphyrinogen oxidase
MKVAVVGGGIAGLAAAHRIVERRAGDEVTVLEAGARTGGVLRSVRDRGWLREHAANAFLSGSSDGAVALCRELGVPLEAPSAAAKRRWIYVGGALHALPAGPGDLARTTLLSARAKLRLLGEPLRPRRDPALGDESIWDFAARRLGPEVADRVVAPFVTGVFAGDAKQISLRSGFPKLAALGDAGGIVRGLLAGRKRGGEKVESLAPRHGVEMLAAALAQRLGARVQLGARVTAITPRPDAVELVIEDDERERFDAVVLAVPAWVLPPMLAEVPLLAAAAGAIAYAPVAIVHLGFDVAQVKHPIDGFGALVAHGEGPRLLGAVLESAIWPGRAPDGHALIRCIFGGTRDPGALDLDDATLVAQARADLRTLFGIDAAPVNSTVARHAHGVAQYRVGHGERVAAAGAVARASRLVLAGSAWHGVAVTDCVSDALRVVKELGQWG